MAETDAGLELPIGLTEQKFLQQLARIEAKAIKSSQKMQQGFVKANADVSKSFGQMSGAAKGQLQNVSYQLQDIFVQIAGGQGAARALSQQLPQLFSGFGALGSALGLVAAVAVPLAATFLNLGGDTVDLAKATEGAEKALAAWKDAAANANVSAAELAVKYGEAAGAARELLNVLAETAEAKAFLEQAATIDALREKFSGITKDVELYRQQTDQISKDNWAYEIADAYSITIEQAERLADIMSELESTEDQNRKNKLLADMAVLLNEAARAGAEVDAELINSTEDAAKAGIAVLEIGAAASGASGQVAALAGDMAALAAQAASAAAAMGAAGVFVGGDGSIQRTGRKNDPSTDWRFEDPNKDYDTLAERRAREAEAAARKAEAAAKRAGGGGGGGGHKRGGGGGRAKREEPSLFQNAEKELTDLQRQIDLIGKNTVETAKMRAEWAMLDEAKKRGVPVNDQLNAQIQAQAEQVGKLTGELEAAELAQDQFDQAIEGIANAFSNAILEGENLRDSLANIFKQIAANILNAGIQNALKTAFSGAGQGGGFWGLLAGAFGGTKAATPSYDGGGFTGMGSRSGGIDGKGGFPAILHPNETVLDHTRGQGVGSAGSVDVRVFMDEGGNWQAKVEQISGGVAARTVAANNKQLPTMMRNVSANPRKRY